MPQGNRKYPPLTEGERRAFGRGFHKGKPEGYREGYAQGHADGYRQGLADAAAPPEDISEEPF